MALIKGGNKLMGAKLFVSTSNGTENIPVEVVNPVFIDPENKNHPKFNSVKDICLPLLDIA